MSYILDALKRADNERERERGAVPGLHSQQVLPPTTLPDDGDSRAWVWLAGAALAIVLGGLAWYQFGPAIQITARPSPLPPPPSVAAPLPAPAITAITAVPAPEPMSASAPAVAAPVPAEVPPTVAAAAAPAEATPARQSVAAQARAARRAAQANEAAARAPTPAPAPTAPPPPAVPVERVYAFNDLPANIRAEIPSVVIGGSSYSSNPKFRMLMVNGQMYQESEKPLPNLVLEQINPKSAVLSYKGYRYRISY